MLKIDYSNGKECLRDFLCEEIILSIYNHINMQNQILYQNSFPNMFGFFCLQQFHNGQYSVIDLNTQASISSDSQPSDVVETKLNQLVAELPSKVFENCQRTARVILLAELQKLAFKEKKLKNQLSKILSQFIPSKSDQESSSEYSNKKGYFESIHYSRVRIGQRHFKKNILLNSLFKEKFQIIFRERLFETCQKARKNERSPISFEKRTKIINHILKEHQELFEKYYNSNTSIGKKEKNQKKIIRINKNQDQMLVNSICENFENQLLPFYMYPIVPIPLRPSDYQSYQKSRLQSQ